MDSELVVISDIHGNYPSLQAVVDREGLDKKYAILGDIMGLVAYPQETLDLVQSLSGYTLAGNHDKAIFEFGEGHVVSDELSQFERDHTLCSLSADYCHYMLSRPYLDVVERGGQRICCCHAYPWPSRASGYGAGNTGINKRDVTQVAATVDDDYDWVFHGHNHSQFDLDCSKFGHDVHFVSCGTLGYKGEYAVVDTDSGTVELKRVDPQLYEVGEHIKEVLPDSCPAVERWLY